MSFNIDYYPEKIKWFTDNGFEELEPLNYYRMLFPVGSFQSPGESNGDFKSNGILQFRNPGDSASSMRTSIIYDDLQTIRAFLLFGVISASLFSVEITMPVYWVLFQKILNSCSNENFFKLNLAFI